MIGPALILGVVSLAQAAERQAVYTLGDPDKCRLHRTLGSDWTTRYVCKKLDPPKGWNVSVSLDDAPPETVVPGESTADVASDKMNARVHRCGAVASAPGATPSSPIHTLGAEELSAEVDDLVRVMEESFLRGNELARACPGDEAIDYKDIGRIFLEGHEASETLEPKFNDVQTFVKYHSMAATRSDAGMTVGDLRTKLRDWAQVYTTEPSDDGTAQKYFDLTLSGLVGPAQIDGFKVEDPNRRWRLRNGAHVLRVELAGEPCPGDLPACRHTILIQAEGVTNSFAAPSVTLNFAPKPVPLDDPALGARLAAVSSVGSGSTFVTNGSQVFRGVIEKKEWTLVDCLWGAEPILRKVKVPALVTGLSVLGAGLAVGAVGVLGWENLSDAADWEDAAPMRTTVWAGVGGALFGAGLTGVGVAGYFAPYREPEFAPYSETEPRCK